MKKTTIKKIAATVISLALAALVIVPVLSANAQTTIPTNYDRGNMSTGINVSQNTDLITLVKNFINWILGFLTLIAVLLILWAGFIWMTAMGDEDKVKKAQDLMKNGIIGLVIILASWSIAAFVISNIANFTGATN